MSRHSSTLSQMAKRLSTETGVKYTACLRAVQDAAQRVSHPKARYELALQQVTGQLTSLRKIEVNTTTRVEQAIWTGNVHHPFDVDRWWAKSSAPLGVWAADPQLRRDFVAHVVRNTTRAHIPVAVLTRDPELVDPGLRELTKGITDLSRHPGGTRALMARLHPHEKTRVTCLLVMDIDYGLTEADYQQMLELLYHSGRNRVLFAAPPSPWVEDGFRGPMRAMHEAVLLDDVAVAMVEAFSLGAYPAGSCPPRPAAPGGGLYLDSTSHTPIPFSPAPQPSATHRAG